MNAPAAICRRMRLSSTAGEHHSEENKARDKSRRQKQTLEFFGFRSDMTVVEIWPGCRNYDSGFSLGARDCPYGADVQERINSDHVYFYLTGTNSLGQRSRVDE